LEHLLLHLLPGAGKEEGVTGIQMTYLAVAAIPVHLNGRNSNSSAIEAANHE